MALSKILTSSVDDIVFQTNKNIIINGSMICSQRGSSHTTEGYGSLDRYYLALSGASSVTMSQQAFSTSDRNSLGFEKYLKLVVGTANNNCGIYQKIEANNAVHIIGSKVTLSFYAKGTNPAGGSLTIQPQWYNNSSGGGDNGVAQSLVMTSTWTRYTFTFDVPAPANTTIDTNAYLTFPIIQPNGDTSTTAWELNLTGLQLELGEQATPFEHEDFGTTLRKCQRYFFKWDETVSGDGALWGIQTVALGSSYVRTPVFFPVKMRSSPSASGLTYNSTSGAVGVQLITPNGATLFANPTLGGSGYFNQNWQMSAEL